MCVRLLIPNSFDLSPDCLATEKGRGWSLVPLWQINLVRILGYIHAKHFFIYCLVVITLLFLLMITGSIFSQLNTLMKRLSWIGLSALGINILFAKSTFLGLDSCQSYSLRPRPLPFPSSSFFLYYYSYILHSTLFLSLRSPIKKRQSASSWYLSSCSYSARFLPLFTSFTCTR